MFTLENTLWPFFSFLFSPHPYWTTLVRNMPHHISWVNFTHGSKRTNGAALLLFLQEANHSNTQFWLSQKDRQWSRQTCNNIMLEKQVQEQGRDPRTCKTALQLRGFLSRANKTIPFYLGTLAEIERPVDTVPFLFEKHTVVTIHSLIKLTNADKKPRSYRIPAIKHFWLEQEQRQPKLATACLPLHCCTYGFSAKLKLHYTHLMTKLSYELCKNDAVLWCAKTRTWHWDKLSLSNAHDQHFPLAHTQRS